MLILFGNSVKGSTTLTQIVCTQKQLLQSAFDKLKFCLLSSALQSLKTYVKTSHFSSNDLLAIYLKVVADYGKFFFGKP